jgi:hypothetical protein
MAVSRFDVIALYRALLERDPENDGVIDGHIASSPSIQDLARNVILSPEFAYRFFLGRAPNPMERQKFRGTLRSNEAARFRLLNSNEFRRQFDDEFLKRPFLWFIHIPKTAGTAIRNGFAALFAERFFWHPVTIGLEDRSGPVFEAIDRHSDFFERIDFCGGHLPKDKIPRSHRKMVFIAVLRDPVARALSLYNYARLTPSHDAYPEVQNSTLWEALSLERKFYHHVYLEQLRYLCGSRDIASVYRAMEEERYILTELSNVPELLRHLKQNFGIPILALDRANENPSGYTDQIRAQPDYARAVDLIRDMNSPEQQLLNRCRPVFDSAMSGG